MTSFLISATYSPFKIISSLNRNEDHIAPLLKTHRILCRSQHSVAHCPKIQFALTLMSCSFSSLHSNVLAKYHTIFLAVSISYKAKLPESHFVMQMELTDISGLSKDCCTITSSVITNSQAQAHFWMGPLCRRPGSYAFIRERTHSSLGHDLQSSCVTAADFTEWVRHMNANQKKIIY